MKSILDYVNRSELLAGWKASGGLSLVLAGILAWAQFQAQTLPPGSFWAFVFGALAIVIPKRISEVKSLEKGDPIPVKNL